MTPIPESWWRSVLEIPKTKENNMKALLKDLEPGDEFEYVDDVAGYRKGRFLVLNTMGSYLQSFAKKDCRFLYSFAAKRVVNHFIKQEIIMKKFTNEVTMKSQKQMGHFIGWKFGVPVKVYEHNPGGCNYPEYEEARLISEDNECFMLVFDYKEMRVHSKQNFHYELIPYSCKNTLGRRYPVCSNDRKTAYCNSLDKMSEIGFANVSDVKKASPAATLNIGDKVIELSDETVANLKAELGI